MDDKPSPPFKRRFWRLPAPAQQLRLIVPAALAVAALIGVAVFSLGRLKARAVAALAAQNASSEAAQAFLRQTDGFSLLLYIVMGLVGLVAVAWVWWLSGWIFGPTRRLEKDLDDLLYGKLDPARLRVRDEDALFPVIEKMRAVLTRPPSGPDDPPAPK